MVIIKTQQHEVEAISKINFDLVLCSSGYESRSRFLVEKYLPNSKRRYCLSFLNYRDFKIRRQNDSAFKLLGYQFVLCDGGKELTIIRLLDELLTNNSSKIINILVDYSSMTRIWYGAILKYFNFHKDSSRTVKIFFTYSFSQFISPPKQKIYNRHVGPIEGFYQLSIPNKPSAVIIGLGYVESRAYGLSEYFDVEPYLFISDNSVSQDFHDQVVKNNSDLISSVQEQNIFYYPLTNLLYTETILSHLCEDLEREFRLILAPCGPKPFTLLSMITSLRRGGVDVWRISAGENEIPQDKKPTGRLSLLEVVFSTDLDLTNLN